MLLDKFRWACFNGHWFAILGALNLLGYGLHLLMPKDNYKYYFAYSAEENRLTQSLKSMIGSEKLENVVWTAPSLIALNYYLHRRLGSLFMTKFFFTSLFSSYIFMSIFNPTTNLNVRPLYQIFPIKLDSNDPNGRYLMGADQMAMSLIFFTLLYHRMWYVALPIMAI